MVSATERDSLIQMVRGTKIILSHKSIPFKLLYQTSRLSQLGCFKIYLKWINMFDIPSPFFFQIK